MPNARASSSPEWTRPSANACNKRSVVTRSLTAAKPTRGRRREARFRAVEHAADVASMRVGQQSGRATREQKQAALLGQPRDADEHDGDERGADGREPDEARREHDEYPGADHGHPSRRRE